MEMAIETMAEVFRLQHQGLADRPQRMDVPFTKGWLRLMPVAIPGLDSFGFKAMNLTPGHGVRYAIWLYDLRSGELRGLLDARLITAMRTAATTAVATDHLARRDVSCAAIIGTGAEARHHLTAMRLVRPASRVNVYSRSPDNRAAFIKEMANGGGDKLIDCATVDEAVAGAELVVLATKAAEPMFRAAHLRPGMHVNSIGSARADQFELAADTFSGFDVIVCDSAAQVFAEAGDAIDALKKDESLARRAEDLAHAIAAGTGGGRASETDVTLYKSVGTATQDIALAHRLLGRAEELGVGTDLGDVLSMKSFR